MLYQNPPYYVINGVSLFPDHADPLQYYYLPTMPHLTELHDESTSQLIPQIQLIKYRGEAGSGGFLNFDVNLGVSDEAFNDIRSKLQYEARLTDRPRLAPVPLVDGAVQLMLLDRQTSDEGGEDDEEDEEAPEDGLKFVTRINHHAKPALYGDNQASFSVELDEAGVVVLEKALQGEMTPIGVVYSLSFLALRPAYHVRVKADWSRVQKHLQKSFGADFLFLSAQIDKVVDKLIEDRVIQIEVDSFIPPGEDAADILARLDQAVTDVKEMVLENFFEPSLDPIREKEDGWDKLTHSAERLSAVGATGGLGGIGAFKYKNIDYTRIDQKHLNVNMSERTTVVRSIHPQAHLRGLFRVLRDSDGAIDLSRFVIPVDLYDDWFRERRVNVIARANFAEDDVESVDVRLDYDGDTKNVILDAARPQEALRWNSVLVDGRMLPDVTVSYRVSFKQADATERPGTLASAEEKITIENYEVRPHDLYNLIRAPIISLDFPWERYPHVEVQTRYSDPANDIAVRETFLLEEKKPETIWKLFTLDPARSAFDYKLIYRAADHRDVEMPWQTTDAEQIIIRDPYPARRKLEVVPAINWNEVNIVFVDVVYEDANNAVREEHSLNFMKDKAGFETVEIALVDPRHRFLTYKATIIYRDGRVQESPPFVTLAQRAIITSNMRGHQIITVRPEERPFSELGIKELSVEMLYEDAGAGLRFADNFTFRNFGETPRYFEYDFAGAEQAAYQYRVNYLHLNGMFRATDWETTEESLLVIPLD